MMKHTKGPWLLGKGNSLVVAAHPTSDYPDSGHDDIAYYGGYLVCESIGTLANGKLIAAAPELLEALQILVGDIERGPKELTTEEKIMFAKAAIKKATE